MYGCNLPACAYICATLLIASTTSILGQQQQHFYRKPWPTYSLQNMPQTQFTCHDKILGGYYADAETQCQMFHVCVKVAGVGVQDFRFLCPNGTAFDQEAQICADWGDVDCEQSVLYYGSDNFDLYRIGSGFESKRAPLAEEEEATFHLQRAESADIRRSKETRIDQKSRPDQPPNYSKTRNSYNIYGNVNANNQQHSQQQHQQQKKLVDVVKRPIVNYYTPTTSTTTSTTERYNDESKQDADDIFKGSHSSHFFANRNGGREDDFIDHPAAKTRFNDFTDFNKKSTEASTTSSKVRGGHPTRPKRPTQTGAASTTTTTSTSTTSQPKLIKKVTLHASYNTDFFDYNQYKSTTQASTTTASTTHAAAAPTRTSYSNANRFSFGAAATAAGVVGDYQTHEKIVPTTYNPGNSIYRVKTTTPKYTEVKRVNTKTSAYTTDQNQHFTATKSYNKPTISARKSQKLERTQQKLLGPQNSTFVNHNEFTEFAKAKSSPQETQPQPFQPSQVFRAPAATQKNIEPQFYRIRGGQQQQPQEQKPHPQKTRVNNQNPAPFSAPTHAQPKQIQRGNGATASVNSAAKDKVKTTISPELRPRGFTSRGSINYKATTQRSGEFYSPTTTTVVKKFSTLVPKDQYVPTTFKPTTYKKPYENYYNYQTQQTVKPAAVNKPQKSAYGTTTNTPTTANPYYNVDEDDGQYHPELYEVDFPKNRLNTQRVSSTTTAPYTTTTTSSRRPAHNIASNYNIQNPQTHLKTQQQSAFQKQQEQQQHAIPVDLSDEEELFKTAHSLNFGAASINKLRADIFKAEKTSQQYNSQYSPNLETSSSPKAALTSTTTTTAFSTSTPSTTLYTYPIYSSTTITTSRPYQTPSALAVTSTAFTTTKRPFTYPTITTTLKTTTYAPPAAAAAAKSSNKSTGKKSKGKKSSKKSTSKRPPHADEDTSYDYAYYDTDTLSETPQEYPEYEIAEFAKTRKN